MCIAQFEELVGNYITILGCLEVQKEESSSGDHRLRCIKTEQDLYDLVYGRLNHQGREIIGISALARLLGEEEV